MQSDDSLINVDFEKYDFYNMSNVDIHNLLKEINLSLGETADKVHEVLTIPTNDLKQEVSKGLSDVNKNLETLTIKFVDSFDSIDKLNENLSNIYFIGIALLVGVGLVAGLLSGIFITRFLR
ncbi:hypothetical protein [Robinsoniella peoriensis]|uniref:hypothetical protein n=1 Tax=Robinsoniella peoriensis TaxID=180332 RepID=UPI0036400D87